MPNKFTIQISGPFDENDQAAAKHVVENENRRRLQEDPDAEVLPADTPNDLRNSYLRVQEEVLDRAHDSYIEQAAAQEHEKLNVRDLWKSATEAQRQEAIRALRKP